MPTFHETKRFEVILDKGFLASDLQSFAINLDPFQTVVIGLINESRLVMEAVRERQTDHAKEVDHD